MEVVRDVYCIKAIDWDIKTFHGYSTPYGTTYNAYLLKGEKNILIDTAKYNHENQFLKIMENILSINKIDYVISNHAEMDHSGLLGKILEKSNATLICSPKGRENLEKHFHGRFKKFLIVENGQVLNLGNVSLQFFHTPMVHWPDSMVTYFPEKKILFSNDAFGQHIATPEFFVDEIGIDTVIREARKYYANIVNPYGNSVKKVLSLLETLKIEMILPSHGLIWKNPDHIKMIIDKYNCWSSNEIGDKILIIYETMWGSTRKMAEKCYLKAIEKGHEAVLVNLEIKHISDVASDVLEAKTLLFGTSILHNQVLPNMAKLIAYLTGLKFSKRKAWTFGSYGWSKSSFEKFEHLLKGARFELPCEGFYVKFVPEEKELEELGKIFAEKILD